ncbi:N-acetyltransferase family protein [Heyndrickxia sporothermodurans]
MNIKRLESKDAELYRNLRLKALKDHPEAFGSSYEEEKNHPIETFADKIHSDTIFTFGAFDQKELIGIVTLVREVKLKLKHRASIFAMYVLPEKRSFGVGNALMTKAINKANELNGIEQIYLSVVSTNSHAKKLYASLGFEKFGYEKRALKLNDQYVDEEHMVLFLNVT